MRDFETLNQNAGEDEAKLQYEYMEKAKAYVTAKAKEKGRPLTYCVNTFGCPIV